MFKSSYREWVRIVSTAFYVGYVPFAPGTFGSLLGFALAWYAQPILPYLLILFSILGISVCKGAEVFHGRKDPSRFVMDEVCGILLSLLWLPHQFWIYVIAFIVFRLLDILKPGPIRILQNHPHPHSIMWDDLAAGFFTNIFVQILVRFLI